MRSWTATEARANMAQVLDAVLRDGPQQVDRRDKEPVVLVAKSDWDRLVAEFPSVADLVLNSGLDDSDLLERRPARAIRAVPI